VSTALDLTKRVFINDESQLRSGWRIVVFVICVIVASIATAGILSTINLLFPSLPLTREPSDPSDYLSNSELVYLTVSRLSNLVSVAAATAVCARLLERRSFGSIGFKMHRGWLRDIFIGSLIGGAALALAVCIIWIAGAVSFQTASHEKAPLAQRSIILAFGAALLFFLIAAAFEELLFRGFIFQAFLRGAGPVWAVLLTSVPFGIAHLGNPSATLFSTLNTVLAGVWLGVAYLVTRSLWLPTGLHFSWNLAMSFFFGLPVSGLVTVDRLAVVNGRIGSPDWMSGGSYGPEGGFAATVALIVATAFLWKSGLFRPSKEMLEAAIHGLPNQPISIIAMEEGEPPA
jgi:membrane protease YdiL (CAAX protease family)